MKQIMIKIGNPDQKWNLLIPIAFITSIVLVFYQSTFGFLFNLWTDFEYGEFSHGLLIIAISFYFLWKNLKSPESEVPIKINLKLIVIAGVFSLMWSLAFLVNVHLAETLMIFGIYAAGVTAFTPKNTLKKISFPILYLLLAVPIWLPLLVPLQKLTVIAVSGLADLFRIPHLVDDYIIQVPGGSFAVELACSGLRYFISALALSTLYGYLHFQKIKVFLLFVAGALAISIVANWFRVFLVIYMGYKTEMTHPWVHEHISVGWYLFAGLLFPYLWFGHNLFKKMDAEGVKTQHGHSNDSIIERINFFNADAKINTTVTAVFLFAIAIGPLISYMVLQNIGQDNQQTIALPHGKNGWIKKENTSSRWTLLSQGADLTTQRSYKFHEEVVDVFAARYIYSRDGAEPIDSSYSFYDRKKWTRKGLPKKISINGNELIEIRLASKEFSEERIVWYWYRVAGHNINNILLAKLYEGWGWITGNSGISIVVISATVEARADGSPGILNQFFDDMAITINDYIDNL